MTGISQQFCVRWNSHLGSLGAAFPQLLAGQQFVDVTLACDGHQVHCHRLVLAACSSYFESLLSENPCKHPIIILPKEIKLWEIHALVDFMYKGQVNVSQAGLPQLLKCAETLQIRGLCGTESSLNEVANGKIDRCDPNILSNSNNCSSNFNFTSMFASNLLNTNYSNADDEQQFRQQQQQHSDLQRCSTFPTVDNAKSINHRSNEILAKGKAPKNTDNDKTTKEHCNATPTAVVKSSSLKRLSDNEASNTGSSELNIKCEEIDSDANAIDDGMDDDIDEHSNSKQSEYAMANVVCEYANESPTRPTSSAGGSIGLDDNHTDYGRSMSPPGKRYAVDSNYYSGMTEPGRRIRRSESLLRQAADNISKGQTFQTVSDQFQIPISTIRFFMARKGILPKRKRGRASTASIEIDEMNNSSPLHLQALDADSCNTK